jgi:hypothetical protein
MKKANLNEAENEEKTFYLGSVVASVAMTK